MELEIDPERVWLAGSTGIYVRAQNEHGRWVNADIATLTKESLITFLRSRGGENEWAESVVLILLGHER
jgi:hypothetical protein